MLIKFDDYLTTYTTAVSTPAAYDTIIFYY